MDSPRLCRGSTVIEWARTHLRRRDVLADSIVATGQSDRRGDRVSRRDRSLQSCRRSAVLGKRPLAPQASCLFRSRCQNRACTKDCEDFLRLAPRVLITA